MKLLGKIWLGIVVLLLLISIPQCMYTGGESFLNLGGKQSALDPQGPISHNQAEIFYLTLYVTLFLFVTVGGVLAYATIRFRSRKTDDPNFMPKQSHGHPLVEVGLVVASTILLVIIAIPTFGGIILKTTVPKDLEADAITVNVTGYQWWWGFEYPEYGFHTANEIVIPAGRAVKLNLKGNDVIHSFWLPKLAGKVDLIPGQNNTMWIKADEPGTFWGQCAEYCGDSHAYMLFRAKALNPEDWKAWMAHQKTDSVKADGTYVPVLLESDENADRSQVLKGASLFKENCARCHSVDSKIQTNGPNLAHFGSRMAIAAGWLENTPENLFHWIKDPYSVKPGNYMWEGFPNLNEPGGAPSMEGLMNANLSDDDVHALVAYLYELK